MVSGAEQFEGTSWRTTGVCRAAGIDVSALVINGSGVLIYSWRIILAPGPASKLSTSCLVHRFRSSMTYSHAAWSSEGVADPGIRAMRRVRSCRVNFHWKGEAICW